MKLYQRSKLKHTAAALNGSPSWNVTPVCSSNVQASPSSLADHSRASSGTTSVDPGAVVTSVSKICPLTRSDSPSEASAGSRMRGSLETPNTSVPPDVWVPPGSVVAPVWPALTPADRGEHEAQRDNSSAEMPSFHVAVPQLRHRSDATDTTVRRIRTSARSCRRVVLADGLVNQHRACRNWLRCR